MSTTGDSLSVPNIFRDDKFLGQLYSASEISYSTNGYAMFCCHTGPYLDENEVNTAIAGRRSDPEQIMEGDGDHIPEKHYTTVIVQLRRMNSTLRPFYHNIKGNNESRQMNSQRAEKGNYVNPLSIIAVGRRVRCRKKTGSGWRRKKIDTFDPGERKNVDLLLFQEMGEQPMNMGDFCGFVSGYCKGKYGDRVAYRQHDEYTQDPFDHGKIKFLKTIPVRFVSTQKAVDFLIESQLFKAMDLKIREGRLSPEDFERLKMFQIVQKGGSYTEGDSIPDEI